jgi:hypothetical protein
VVNVKTSTTTTFFDEKQVVLETGTQDILLFQTTTKPPKGQQVADVADTWP